VPSIGISSLQIGLAFCEVLLTCGALYFLLPAMPYTFVQFMVLFVASQLVAFVSQTPGGVGSFDAMILFLLKGTLPVEGILASLLVFRMVYYIVPLLIALMLFFTHEARRKRKSA
jgi:uncharacterized membrane protein YbhN (UPF0104 family)